MLSAEMYFIEMEQRTQKHQGKIVQLAIKKTGYQMKAVAKGLGIARNTLYIRLQETELEDAFIIQVSHVIHYDFSKDFPEVYKRAKEKLKNNPKQFFGIHSEKSTCFNELPHYDHAYQNPYFIDLQVLTDKYLMLMERYHRLLRILILLANTNELVDIKEEIIKFLIDEGKENA